MSETKNLDYQGSYEKLMPLYTNTFFTKLANVHGIRAANDEEATQLLTLAAKLRRAEIVEQTKTAGARASVISEAHQDLDRLLGVPASASNTAEDTHIKAAAAELAKTQEMRDAALLYSDYLTQLAAQAK